MKASQLFFKCFVWLFLLFAAGSCGCPDQDCKDGLILHIMPKHFLFDDGSYELEISYLHQGKNMVHVCKMQTKKGIFDLGPANCSYPPQSIVRVLYLPGFPNPIRPKQVLRLWFEKQRPDSFKLVLKVGGQVVKDLKMNSIDYKQDAPHGILCAVCYAADIDIEI